MRLYTEHSKEVTDLCFDGSAEYLASCSADGSAAVSGSFSGCSVQGRAVQARAGVQANALALARASCLAYTSMNAWRALQQCHLLLPLTATPNWWVLGMARRCMGCTAMRCSASRSTSH